MVKVPEPNQGEKILTDETGLVVPTWYRFFAQLFRATGGGTGAEDIWDNGDPEGEFVANRGSQFHRLDGGAGTSLYIKESGDGLATGWAAK